MLNECGFDFQLQTMNWTGVFCISLCSPVSAAGSGRLCRLYEDKACSNVPALATKQQHTPLHWSHYRLLPLSNWCRGTCYSLGVQLNIHLITVHGLLSAFFSCLSLFVPTQFSWNSFLKMFTPMGNGAAATKVCRSLQSELFVVDCLCSLLCSVTSLGS